MDLDVRSLFLIRIKTWFIDILMTRSNKICVCNWVVFGFAVTFFGCGCDA